MNTNDIKKQAEEWGHKVVGALRQISDALSKRNNEVVALRCYADEEGTTYAVDENNQLSYISGEGWVS